MIVSPPWKGGVRGGSFPRGVDGKRQRSGVHSPPAPPLRGGETFRKPLKDAVLVGMELEGPLMKWKALSEFIFIILRLRKLTILERGP